MFILDINQNKIKEKPFKTSIVFLIVSILTFVVNKVYALFGHGVSSDAMTFMFLYPLLGGALFYLLIELLLPKVKAFVGYRIFYNLYNSGIALLTAASFLRGIVEIAGTNSSFVAYYYGLGYLSMIVSLFILIVLTVNYKKAVVK